MRHLYCALLCITVHYGVFICHCTCICWISQITHEHELAPRIFIINGFWLFIFSPNLSSCGWLIYANAFAHDNMGWQRPLEAFQDWLHKYTCRCYSICITNMCTQANVFGGKYSSYKAAGHEPAWCEIAWVYCHHRDAPKTTFHAVVFMYLCSLVP